MKVYGTVEDQLHALFPSPLEIGDSFTPRIIYPKVKITGTPWIKAGWEPKLVWTLREKEKKTALLTSNGTRIM
jgi:hypothetical protein